MVTKEINGHKITTWESIDEMPISRYYAFNRYSMLSDSLGSSFADIERNHLGALAQIIDDKKKALQQIANLRELVFNILNDQNFEHRAYCSLIHDIDGKLVTDVSETGIDGIIKQLDEIGVTNGDIKKKTKRSKKGLIKRLTVFSLTDLIRVLKIIIMKRSRKGKSL